LHGNVIDCMKSLISACKNLDPPIEIGPEWSDFCQQIRDFDDSKKFSPEFAEKVIELYTSEPIKAANARRNEFWLLDSFDKFFEKRSKADQRLNIQVFAEEGYVPNDDDCTLARIRTTGIHVAELEQPIKKDHKYESDKLKFQVVDVGGQRNERRKWINCFDDAKAILFICNLAGYNQVLFEDTTKNRLIESLEVFQKIVTNGAFEDTPIFVFLNKKDIFEKMIKERPLNEVIDHDKTKLFADYGGGTEVQAGIAYVEQLFRARVPVGKEVNFEPVSARVKSDIRNAFSSVKKTLYDMNRQEILDEVASLHKAERANAGGGCCLCGGSKNDATLL